MTMTTQERIERQLGALLLANLELQTQLEAARARLEEMAPKTGPQLVPEPYPDKTKFVG